MFRKMFLVVGLGAAVGVPLLISSGSGLMEGVKGLFGGSDEKQANPTFAEGEDSLGSKKSPRAAVVLKPQLAGIPTYDLTEVLRFDATPAWIVSRWSNVSTVTSNLKFSGYRVAITTGTKNDSLAGTLTYYFDEHQKAQRITFQGSTGDPRTLIHVLQQRYKFVRVSPEHNQLGSYRYQVLWSTHATSELRITPAPVLRTDIPLRRFTVELEINQPNGQLSRMERKPQYVKLRKLSKKQK